jgi:formylglycine-generating enzyme required for sulfatase activity
VALFGAHARLHDMLGNAWELTLDCYSNNYDQTPRDGSAYLSAKCDTIVARGGSFMNSPKGLRVSIRAKGAIDAPATNFGFRVVKELR